MLKKYLLFRYGIFLGFASFVLLFCMFVLGRFAFDGFRIFRYEKTEAAVHSLPSLKKYKNKRGTNMYSIRFNAEYVVDGTTYSTSEILPFGKITSNCATLLKWNYRGFLDEKSVFVYYRAKDPADGFVFYIGGFVCMIILFCCGLTVGAVVVIQTLIKKVLHVVLRRECHV